MKKHPTNKDGYEAVLSYFYVDGKRDGAMAAVAKALGVTRAAVSVWRDVGIPLKHVPKLKQLTGLRGRDILPEVAALMD